MVISGRGGQHEDALRHLRSAGGRRVDGGRGGAGEAAGGEQEAAGAGGARAASSSAARRRRCRQTRSRDAGSGGGDITVNQMYVQYQIPPNGGQHVPVVMVHGCCLSSKTWETTPDGRMGWNEYFVRKGRPVYLADQSSRARSGFDPSTINAVKAGTVPPGQLPNVLSCQPPDRVDASSASVRASARRFPTGSFPSKRWTSSTSR